MKYFVENGTGEKLSDLVLISHASEGGLVGSGNNSGIYSPIAFTLWAMQEEAIWEYRNEMGDFSLKEIPSDQKLEYWVKGIEAMKKRGAITTTELIKELNKLGFEDNPLIISGGCNSGSINEYSIGKYTLNDGGFAGYFSKEIGFSVIAASPNIYDAETQTYPTSASETEYRQTSNKSWTQFSPDAEPISFGGTKINLMTGEVTR